MQYRLTLLVCASVIAVAAAAPGYPTYYPSSYYSKPNFYDNVEDKALGYETQQGYSDNENDNANANDNLAGAKSEVASENANLAKGGEAFGFGALESDNRNLLANENNIEVANANKNELGVEVANFNANENSAEQEAASVAEVTNEDEALFADFLENETDNLNLNDNVNDRLNSAAGFRGYSNY